MPSIAARGGRCTTITTLDRLAAQIDISNQTLMQAEAAYRQARALVRQDASGLYPTVTGGAGYTQSGSGCRFEPRYPGHRGQRELGQRRPVQRRAEVQLGDRPVGPHPPPDRERFGGGPGQRRRPRQCAAVGAGQHGDQLLLHAHLRAAHAGLPGVGGGLHALGRDRAEPARCRHREPRRPRPGADPARADARPAGRREHHPRHLRACRGRAGRQGAVRAQRRARAGAAGGADRRARHPLDAARAAARHRLGRAPDGGGQRPDRRGRRRLLSQHLARQHGHPGRQQPECAAHPQQRGVVGRPDSWRRR